MVMYTVNKNTKSRKLLFLAGAAALLIAAGAGWYFLIRTPDNQTAIDESGINFNPPTAEEQAAADAVKEDLPVQNENDETTNPNTPTSSTNKKRVTPVMTYAEQVSKTVEVGGYVEGIIEKGGTCTLTFTKGSAKVTHTKTALDDAQNTSCGLMEVPVSKLSAGTWEVRLSYDSSKASGTSSARNVKVQ